MDSSDIAVENKRKKLIFRSWHRGTREMDLLMGRFADAHLPDFTPDQLTAYEDLLGENDPDLYNWVSRREPVPERLNSHEILNKLLTYNS